MKRALVIGAAVASALAIILLREETMSRHVDTDPTSRSEVVVRVHTLGPARAPHARARALVDVCALEVDGKLVEGSLRPLGGDDYAFLIQPALDDSERRQLHGCLEDAVVDHVQGRVLAVRDT